MDCEVKDISGRELDRPYVNYEKYLDRNESEECLY